MKEFNLEEYLKNPSQKVVTRDGREVRIICTDMKSLYKIVGLVYDKEEDTESVEIFHENGTLFAHTTSNYDLFFAPTKRERWINIYQDIDCKEYYLTGIIYDSEKEAKEAIKDDPEFIATTKIEWEE